MSDKSNFNKKQNISSSLKEDISKSKTGLQIKDLLFGQAFTASVAGLSDFLQPLGNLTFILLIISIIATATLILLYFIKENMRGMAVKYFTLSFSLLILTGALYASQNEENSKTGVLANNFSFLESLQSSLGVIESNITEIKESTLRTEKLVEEISVNTQENVSQTKQLNQTLVNTTEILANKLDNINESFSQLSKLGGVIANPESPEEFYHNSKVYEEKGDYINARRSYNQYFEYNLGFIDPHIRYQTFLKIQEGRAGAREIYNLRFRNQESPSLTFIKILLLDSPLRLEKLKSFVKDNKDFAPAYYELSREYNPERSGVDTLEFKNLEVAALEEFIKLDKEGKFVRYFIDKSLASSWIEDAIARLNILNLSLNQIIQTYFEDGSLFKETNYKNGIKEGIEKVYANKNKTVSFFFGKIIDHSSASGYAEEISLNDVNWLVNDNLLIQENHYEAGLLKKTISKSYYSTGEIYLEETRSPMSKEYLDQLDKIIWGTEILLQADKSYDPSQDPTCQGDSRYPDGGGRRGGFACNRDWSIRSSESKLDKLKSERDDGMFKDGPTRRYYKNGVIEAELIYKDNELVSKTYFDSDGEIDRL